MDRVELNQQDEVFLHELREELSRAREKFPSANLSFVALVEEVGELGQALLKHRAGNGTKQAIYGEAIQVAAMAMRVALEPDQSFNVSYSEAPDNWQERIDQARKDHT